VTLFQQYFRGLSNNSEYALSLLGRGRLCEGVIPKSASLLCKVYDFIGLLLSECDTSGLQKHCFAMTVLCINSTANSPVSVLCTSQPVILLLYDVFYQIEVMVQMPWRRASMHYWGEN